MDSWTYLEDMHYPVAPGSFRFGTGYGAKTGPKHEKSFNLVCIRSGVKAPLLSDLSHRAKIRYGLDVVMQRPSPPREYISHEDYVPPPTANESVRKGFHRALPKHVLSNDRSTVDFKKLQPYRWTMSDNKEKVIAKAPDLLYRNTFGENNQANSNLLSPRPEIRGFGETPRSSSPLRTPGRIPASQPNSTRPSASRLSSPPKCVSRPTSEGAPRPPTREPRKLSGHKLLRSMSDMGDLQPNIKPLSAGASSDQREGLNGISGCLFSQVKQSIKFVRKVERGEAIDVPRLVRPLNSENGRYRPHSRTKIETPRMQSPEHSYRDHKSADAYLKIISPPKTAEPMSAMKGARSYTSMGSPAMTDIINQYMTSHERYNTPTSALQRVSDANRPASRSSTRQSVRFDMPDWARAETGHNDTESELDPTSRVASRAEKVTEVPAVHILYADKTASSPNVTDNVETHENVEGHNQNDSNT